MQQAADQVKWKRIDLTVNYERVCAFKYAKYESNNRKYEYIKFFFSPNLSIRHTDISFD